jgi:hypothetical protein
VRPVSLRALADEREAPLPAPERPAAAGPSDDRERQR